MVAVGCLIESASAGWWVVERNGGGLGEQPERAYGKELGDPVHTKRQGFLGLYQELESPMKGADRGMGMN